MQEENAHTDSAADKNAGIKTLSAAEQRRLNKEREAEERRRARQSEKLEQEISELEEKIAEIEQEICKPENMTDYELLGSLSKQREEAQERLSAAYDEWAEMQ